MASESGTSGRGRIWVIVLALVAALIVGAVAGVALFGRGGASAAAATLEPAASSGADPFTASVAIGPAVDFPGNVRAITAATRKELTTDDKTGTLLAVGTTPGLYGGTGDKHVCDPKQLVAFLDEHSDKAAAWASVLGIAPKDIAAYVATLTPVVLTGDTLVTNHGYRNGRATRLQSVLQAGTAVMVDATGAPRVKCNCGNPLSEPAPIRLSSVRGDTWPGYQPNQVTVINRGTTTVKIVVINVVTGDNYDQPTGGGNGGAGQFVAAGTSDEQRQTTISSSDDGSTWTTSAVVPGAVRGLAWGNGVWHALRVTESPVQTAVLESADLRTWKSVATVPDRLADMAYNDGRWIAVGQVTVQSSGEDAEFPPAAVYSSGDGHAWARVASIDTAPPFGSVAYGNGEWIAVGSGIHEYGSPSITYRSTDGTSWTRQNDTGLTSQGDSRLAFGSGQWALGGYAISLTASAGPYPDGIVSLSTNATTWTSTPGAHFPQNQIAGIAYGDGQWLAIGRDGSRLVGGNPSSQFFASSDGKTWSKRGHLDPAGFDLAFGGGSTTPTTDTTTTTTPASPASSLRSIDWRNEAYDDLVCGTEKPQKFTNGIWSAPGPATCGMSFTAVDYADVTGDGVEDAIVTGGNHASGTVRGESSWTAVFTASPSGPVGHDYLQGEAFPPYPAGGTIAVWNRSYRESDPGCCPSDAAKDTYTYSSSTGLFTKTGHTVMPISALPKR